MAARTPQAKNTDGAAVTWHAASSGGDTMANTNQDVLVLARNTHGSASRTVTIAAVQTTRPANGAFPASTIANRSIVIAAGATAFIGPLPAAFNDSSGLLALTYSDSGADIQIAGLRTT